MSAGTVISDAAGLATAVGVLLVAAQLFFGCSQARTTFEDDVAAQYRSLIKPRLTTKLLAQLPEDSRRAVEPFYEYSDLSNEEVFLRVQGRVRRRTWIEWSKGIEENLEREPFSGAWRLLADSELREFGELRLLLETAYVDPWKWNAPWRRLFRRQLPVTPSGGDR